MIRPIDIRLNAAHPELPLPEAVTFTGSPSTVLVRGVPPNCGRWAITAVFVAASFPDGSTTTRAAVQSANGVWVATLPATATSGRTANGLRVMADGIDENGDAVTGYILGVADFAVASLDVTPAPEPGETSYQMLYFDEVPSTLHKGDVAKIDGVLKFYNGSAWEPFAAPVTFDDAVTRTSANGVKSSGIWSAIWGALSALPTGFTSLYDWCVAQIAKLRGKTDLNVYGYGNASVSFPDGFSITYDSETYTAPSGGESIEFYGPIESTSQTGYYFWVPYEYKDDTDFNPVAQNVWCLTRDKYLGAGNPTLMLFATTSNYIISDWNATAPTLTLSTGEVTGGAPTMARPLGATGDTLAKVSQMNTALAGKANRAPNPTDGNLAALDEYGNPTDSGKTPYDFALADIIAPEWDFNSTYEVGDLCTSFDADPSHMGTWLYKCILAPDPQQMMPPEVDTTHWALATVEDVLAALRTALAGKADVSAIPYDRITITTGQLQDHAVQKVTLNAATTTLSLPVLTNLTGKVSDFGIDMVNGYAPSDTPTAASFQLDGTIGTDYNLIVPEGEDWSEMTALAAGEMAVYYFTLSAFQINDKPTWEVMKKVVTLVPVPVAP